MFNPGATVCHRFIIPFMANELDKVVISYKQDGYIVLEKTITSGFQPAEAGKTLVEATFSQAESLLFQEKKDFTIQLNVLAGGSGARMVSAEIKSCNGVQHHKEVIASE